MRPSFPVQRNAGFRKEIGVDFFTDRCDYGVGGDVYKLARRYRFLPTVCAPFTELHLFATQNSVFVRNRRKQFFKFNSVFQGKFQFFRIGGHKLLGSAVYDKGMFDPFRTLCNAGGIHRGVSRTEDHNVFPQLERFGRLLRLLKEFDNICRRAFFQSQRTLLPRADSKHNMGKALFLEPFNGTLLAVIHEGSAEGGSKLNVLPDRRGRDSELRDDVLHDTAGARFLFKHGNVCPIAG